MEKSLAKNVQIYFLAYRNRIFSFTKKFAKEKSIYIAHFWPSFHLKDLISLKINLLMSGLLIKWPTMNMTI